MVQISLQKKIYLFLISFVLLSFVLIGAVTLLFFSNENERYHAERLLRKERTVLSSINFFLANQEGDIFPFYTKEFSDKVEEISIINKFDINVYDVRGDLITSTRMDLFTDEVIPWKIAQETIEKLARRDSTILEIERETGRSFLSTYSYIYNTSGNPVAIVNIPYFSDQTLNKQEIVEFLTSLSQIYLFLLIGALLLAYFISNSITRPLRVLKEKMAKVGYDTTNEQIDWKGKDEIGMLIQDYNNMVVKLQESAVLLAQSERESAWREMAKQVAHEIKNPLTPMKLSVQQLSRAWKEEENLEERMTRFSKSMVEQIDNLADIASEFSNFAKMPRAELRMIELGEIAKNAISIFRETEKVEFELKGDLSVQVFADPKQISRVFINLIKNATQALAGKDDGAISVFIKDEGEFALVEIKDNGKGIEDSMKKDIFLPNFTTKSGGMGIGLSMVKSIIENAGGSITFDSSINRGSTFRFSLPTKSN
ncbi:ATP-binding protein [Salibacteraceae bacterium]|nr:ATP-binding protein [Salibacteraceae bacterium]